MNSTQAYFIAEIGQNHQGDVDTAIKYVDLFTNAGANCVKLQKRDNRYLFDKASYDKEYNSENAFADTYGAHREALELSEEEMTKVREHCRKIGVDFMCTPFDEPSLDFLVAIEVDAIKIASFDLGNLPLLDKIGKTQIPVVMSVGGGDEKQIRASVDCLSSHHSNITILHCVSEYPCPAENLGLSEVTKLIKEYPDYTIGSSDHFNGILSGPVAYMLGARVFEKHVTLNRALKGTDHSFALEPDGFRKFVRDTQRVSEMLPRKDKNLIGTEPVFKKLGKSLCAAKDIAEGEVFDLDNLSGKIYEQNYIPVRDSYKVIGTPAKISYKRGDPIQE